MGHTPGIRLGEAVWIVARMAGSSITRDQLLLAEVPQSVSATDHPGTGIAPVSSSGGERYVGVMGRGLGPCGFSAAEGSLEPFAHLLIRQGSAGRRTV